ncbi:MAG: hypothetical protein Q9208_001014 [Pyrenodesmia sp. 3 TL-2023]
MKVSGFLTAALCIETILAFPFAGLEPSHGKALLVARVGGSSRHGSGHRSSSQSGRAKEQTGYRGSQRHPDAPARDRERVNKALDEAPSVKGVKIPVREEGDRPRPGELAMYNDHNKQGDPRTTYVMGDRANKHTKLEMGREQWYPNERDAERRLASPAEYGKMRSGTLGDVIAARDTYGPGPVPKGTREEKKFARLEHTPVNYDKVGRPGVTVGWAPNGESSTLDGAAGRKMGEIADQHGDRDRRVYRVQANPSKKMQENYDPKENLWLKGPSGRDIGQNTPEREMYPVPESMYLARRRSDGSDAARSDSPPRSDRSRSSNHRRRTPDLTIRSKDKSGRRRRHDRKRDAVDQAAQAQTNAESSHPDTTANGDFRQEYQDYLQAFSMLRTNATNVLMPIVEDMVDGSDSDLIWGMAWEILSLAEPSIQVTGSLFHGGMHACDWYEDSVRNTTDEESMKMLLAVDEVLIDIYQSAWAEATEALDEAGYSEDMWKLQNAMVTNDTSVAELRDDTTNLDFIVGFFQSLEDSNLTAPYDFNSTSSENSTSEADNTSSFSSTDTSATSLVSTSTGSVRQSTPLSSIDTSSSTSGGSSMGPASQSGSPSPSPSPSDLPSSSTQPQTGTQTPSTTSATPSSQSNIGPSMSGIGGASSTISPTNSPE